MFARSDLPCYQDVRLSLGLLMLRKLTSLLLLSLLGGCKIVILGHNVGGVVSETGAFDCPAGETCRIDVVDIHFRETFTGRARHPNYRFTGWQKGGRHFCGGGEGPCELSTAGFADNRHLLALLESDETFFLIPQYERVGPVETAELEFRDDGGRRVYDDSGRLLGTLEMDPVSNQATGVNLHFRGYAQHYSLPLEHRGVVYAVSNPINDLVYDGPGCRGDSLPELALSTEVSMGFVSPDTRWPVVVGPEPQIYIMDPVGRTSRRAWYHRWDSADHECLADPGEPVLTGPLVLTDLVLDYPLSVEGWNPGSIVGPVPDYLDF